MAYSRAIVNVSGRYNGVLCKAGDEVSLVGVPLSRVRGMVEEGRISPIGLNAAPPSVDNTEMGYLDGVTSNLQTQLDGKASTAAIAHMVVTGDLAAYVAVDDLQSLVAASADFAAFKVAVAAFGL